MVDAIPPAFPRYTSPKHGFEFSFDHRKDLFLISNAEARKRLGAGQPLPEECRGFFGVLRDRFATEAAYAGTRSSSYLVSEVTPSGSSRYSNAGHSQRSKVRTMSSRQITTTRYLYR